MSDPELNGTMLAALELAATGVFVFPVHGITSMGMCDCGNSECAHPGKHPRTGTGHKAASIDAQQVEKWWSQFPTANIGIACAQSGFVVIDVDPRNGGAETMKQLLGLHGEFTNTLTAKTGGGGAHYFFSAKAATISFPASLGAGVDVKHNGYVVAPPSRHASGSQYEWLDKNATAAPVPSWVANAPEPPAVIAAALPVIVKGSRNTALASLAGKLRHSGLDADGIEAALLSHNAVHCKPPVTHAEVRQIAASIGSYPVPMPTTMTSTEPLKTYGWTELIELSQEDPPTAVVEGLLLPGAVLLIYGFAGVGKSMVALELAMAIHRGEKAFGKLQTTKARVGLIDEESPLRPLGERLGLLAVGREIDLSGKPDLPVFTVGGGARLDSPEGAERVRRWVVENDLQVLVLDTQRRVTPTLKENDSDDMAKLAANIAWLRQQVPNLAIVIIHHSKKPNQGGTDAELMARGSGDIVAAVDSAVFLERVADSAPGPKLIKVEQAKARWSVPIEPFCIRIETTEDGGIRLVDAGSVAAVIGKVAQARTIIRGFLEVADAKTASRGEIIDEVLSQGISQGTAQAALNKMKKAVEVTVTGGDGKKAMYTLQAPDF